MEQNVIRSKALAVILPVLLLASCADIEGSRAELDLAKFSRQLGIDLYSFDGAVRPQDDFYRFVNGRWLAAVEIPAEQASLGTFTDMVGRVDATLYAIIQDLLGRPDEALSPDQRILRDTYLAWLDTEGIEALGLLPVRQVLDEIAAAAGPGDLARLFGRAIRKGIDGPVEILILPDARDTTTYRLQLAQAGLGLPDRKYYIQGEGGIPGDSEIILNKYRKYIANMFVLAGLAMTAEEAELRAYKIVNLETRLATAQRGRVENRDREKSYNKYTPVELSALTPALNWTAFLAGLGVTEPEFVIVRQPEYLVALSAAMADHSLMVWKDYLAFHAINGLADLMPAQYGDLKFAFYRGTLQGIMVRRPLHRRAIAYVNRDLGDIYGRLYVERVFSPYARGRVQKMAAQIRAAFGRRIERLDWMSPKTRLAAQEKLSRLDIKIGYPDDWPQNSELRVSADDLFGNAMRIAERDAARHLSRVDGPVDRNEWAVSPQTVNAFYNAATNDVVVPAGLLQAPFFSLTADSAVNYGGIGAIIGHEISHAFDDQGRKSNGEGNLENWWSAHESQEFISRAGGLTRQYETYRPLEGLALDGRLTLGENLGDLGGLEAAYNAYLGSHRKSWKKRIFNFDGRQRFFLGWAQIWRRTYREKELRRRLVTDTHSPAEFRVNGILPNISGFYDAFGVGEGDALYRAPEDRVSIW